MQRQRKVSPSRLLAVLAAGAVAMAGPTGTAVEAAEPITPDQAVRLALENHPMLSAAGEEVEAARADSRLATSGYVPRIDLTEDLVRSTNPVFVFASKLGQERFGLADFALEALNSPDPFTNAATRVRLRQNVWDGGRTVLGMKAARHGVDAAEGALERTREQIAYGALRAFWDAVLADEMLGVARAGEEAASANVELTGNLVESGLAVPSDRLSAEVRLAEVRAMRIRAEQGVRLARAALRQALGIEEDRDWKPVPPEDPRGEIAGGTSLPAAHGGDAGAGPGPMDMADAEGAVALAMTGRPDLRAIDERIAQATLGEKIARSGYFPEIGVGAQYEWNDPNLFGSAGSNWTVGASIRIPIFEGTETGARRARARADHMRIESMREAMVEGIRLEVRAAWTDLISARQRLDVADTALEQSEEALRIVRERYTEGMAVVVELLGAEAARTQARGNRVSAARDLAVARAALDLSTGAIAGAGPAGGGQQ